MYFVGAAPLRSSIWQTRNPSDALKRYSTESSFC
jgi:hypothetical protein